jgi:hypothetical protein
MIMSKPTLQSRLLNSVPHSAGRGDKVKIRERMEERLVPLGISRLARVPRTVSRAFRLR